MCISPPCRAAIIMEEGQGGGAFTKLELSLGT